MLFYWLLLLLLFGKSWNAVRSSPIPEIQSRQDTTKFSAHSNASYSDPVFKFCGLQLEYSSSVSHLGNTLSADLCDNEDILLKCCDMIGKANTLLSSFPYLNPSLLTSLFQTYCLFLHGVALWKVSNTSLWTLEVSFIKVLRKVWKLPRTSHTRIVHCVAWIQSLVNLTPPAFYWIPVSSTDLLYLYWLQSQQTRGI